MDFLTPLLTLGSTFLGSLFGKNDNTTTVDNKNSTTQSVADSTAGGTSSTSQTGTTSQNTTASTTGNTATNTNESQNQDVSGNVSRLDDTTKNLLTGKVQSLLGSIDSSSSAIDSAIQKMQGGTSFDAEAFVSGIAKQAQANATGQLEADTSKMLNHVGADSDTNSAAALLKARLLSDSASNVAGITSQAQLTAAQITGQNADTLTKLTTAKSADTNQLLGNLLNAGQTEKQLTSGVTSGATGTTTGTQANTAVAGTSADKQSTVTAQKQTQNQTDVTSETAQENKANNTQDWTSFFSGIGKMLNPTF